MTIIEAIRNTGATIALENQIFSNEKIDTINISNVIVQDFIDRLITDLLEFNTMEQFDVEYSNLFNRAFMYSYGKGAEIALYSRLGNTITKINYEFDKAMQGICGEALPEHLRFKINSKSNAMLEMYYQMFQQTKGSQSKMISENVNFENCISTILNVAFFCGLEICLINRLSEEDKAVKYIEEQDKPYDYDNYNQKYKIEDFRVINYSIGKFKDLI
ncbi:MAG: hypothetical protein JSU07_12940 [Bacteroidetes bacterium]|nr:hypothetical protein [Bacteroidota bacterium]